LRGARQTVRSSTNLTQSTADGEMIHEPLYEPHEEHGQTMRSCTNLPRSTARPPDDEVNLTRSAAGRGDYLRRAPDDEILCDPLAECGRVR